MKKFLYILLTLSLTGCTNDFEKINLNPIAPVDVQPEHLLRKILFDYAEKSTYEGFVAGNLLGQLFTAVDFNLFDRHSLTEPQYGGNPWDYLYENLRDNEILLKKSRSNQAFRVYEGPALVYKALLTQNLTDLYGDVPYSEAFNGKAGNVTPSYDKQEDIYLKENGILNNLDKAIASMKAYSSPIKLQGDIIYNGDLQKWVKLAHSLKLKALMRISSKVDVSSQLSTLVNEGNLMFDPIDNAVYSFTLSQPNNFRMTTARIGDFSLFIMSKTIEEQLKNLNDPRISTYFRPAANNVSSFQGLLNGPDASNLSISVGDYSFAGTIFRENPVGLKANFLSSFEVNFLLAEAAERRFINSNTKELYELGVEQAFQFWNTELPTDYLTKGKAAYKNNGQNGIEQIITQKWLANIINGYEGWIENRRTGFPKFKKIAASLNNDLLPQRLPYPATENALNNTNFINAASATNSNSINSPVWWSK